MSSPPEGKLETKAGHPPAGTDSFPTFSPLVGPEGGLEPAGTGRGAGRRAGEAAGLGRVCSWGLS